MNGVVIQLHVGTALFSRIIQIGMRSRYSHASLLFPDGRVLEAVENEGGVVWDAGGEYARTDVYDVPVPDPGASYDWAKDQFGAGYDYAALLGFSRVARIIAGALTHGDWAADFLGSDERWFCSELCLAALIRGGFMAPDIPAARVSPEDLYRMIIPAGATLIRRIEP